MQFIIYFFLSIVLFFVQNWVGKKSYSFGYINFSLLDEKEEAHSINIAIKILSPIIFLILIASVFEYYSLNKYKHNINFIIYFYVAIRLFLIAIYERILIVNWPRIILYYATLITLANYITKNLINQLSKILPDFSELKNELWLLIIIFLFNLFNKGIKNNESSDEIFTNKIPILLKRKKRYILAKAKSFFKKYKKPIFEESKENMNLVVIFLAIIIYENFNRPKIIRFIETKIVKIFGVALSQGIMQVKSNLPLNDYISVVLGSKNLYKKHEELFMKNEKYNLYPRIIKSHNPDKKYVQEILFLCKVIIDNFQLREGTQELQDAIIDEFDLYD